MNDGPVKIKSYLKCLGVAGFQDTNQPNQVVATDNILCAGLVVSSQYCGNCNVVHRETHCGMILGKDINDWLYMIDPAMPYAV